MARRNGKAGRREAALAVCSNPLCGKQTVETKYRDLPNGKRVIEHRCRSCGLLTKETAISPSFQRVVMEAVSRDQKKDRREMRALERSVLPASIKEKAVEPEYAPYPDTIEDGPLAAEVEALYANPNRAAYEALGKGMVEGWEAGVARANSEAQYHLIHETGGEASAKADYYDRFPAYDKAIMPPLEMEETHDEEDELR